MKSLAKILGVMVILLLSCPHGNGQLIIGSDTTSWNDVDMTIYDVEGILGNNIHITEVENDSLNSTYNDSITINGINPSPSSSDGGWKEMSIVLENGILNLTKLSIKCNYKNPDEYEDVYIILYNNGLINNDGVVDTTDGNVICIPNGDLGNVELDISSVTDTIIEVGLIFYIDVNPDNGFIIHNINIESGVLNTNIINDYFKLDIFYIKVNNTIKIDIQNNEYYNVIVSDLLGNIIIDENMLSNESIIHLGSNKLPNVIMVTILTESNNKYSKKYYTN